MGSIFLYIGGISHALDFQHSESADSSELLPPFEQRHLGSDVRSEDQNISSAQQTAEIRQTANRTPETLFALAEPLPSVEVAHIHIRRTRDVPGAGDWQTNGAHTFDPIKITTRGRGVTFNPDTNEIIMTGEGIGLRSFGTGGGVERIQPESYNAQKANTAPLPFKLGGFGKMGSPAYVGNTIYVPITKGSGSKILALNANSLSSEMSITSDLPRERQPGGTKWVAIDGQYAYTSPADTGDFINRYDIKSPGRERSWPAHQKIMLEPHLRDIQGGAFYNASLYVIAKEGEGGAIHKIDIARDGAHASVTRLFDVKSKLGIDKPFDVKSIAFFKGRSGNVEMHILTQEYNSTTAGMRVASPTLHHLTPVA